MPKDTKSANSNKPISTPVALRLVRLGFRFVGHLAPILAGRIAYKLWFTPTRFQTPAPEIKAMESANIEHLQLNNHTIATYSWGETGPTVLLVHGWSGRGTQLFSFVEPLIDAGYRVLSFDAPAHGKSSGKQTNLYEVAEVILALQHHYGIFDSVITHSFGGPCTAIAMQRGLTPERIISISPPATTVGLVEKFCNTLQIPEKVATNLKQRIETTFGRNIWDDLSMVNVVKEITIPGMLIHDSNDKEIPWQESHAIAEAWSNASFIKTSGLGHRRILQDATVVDSAVRFINRESDLTNSY